MQNNNYLLSDKLCVESQFFKAIKQEFSILQNKNDKTNIKNILKVIKGFIVQRRSVQNNQQFTVKKKVLGVLLQFYSKKNELNKTYIKIKRTGLDQLQIFQKKFFEGLDIFYFLLVGIRIDDLIFKEIRKEFKDIFSILISVGEYYYQKNENQQNQDVQEWESFKTNIQTHFDQNEMKNLLKILIFCTVIYFEDQRETSENLKKLPGSLNKVENSGNDSQEIEEDISTNDFISSEPSLDDLSKIIQTKWEVQAERPSVNSFKIIKRNEHGVCIYLFTQLVNMIFSRIEKKFEIEDRNLYKKIIENQIFENQNIENKNISFYLVAEKSGGGGLPDLLQDMIRTIVLDQQKSAQTFEQMNELSKQNKFQLEIKIVRKILKCEDARLDFIKFNRNKI